jgi:glycosyltransferase involved in cell wall biosynthesis
MPEAIEESDVVVATWCMTAYIVDAVKGRKGIPAYYCQHHEPIFFFRPDEQESVAKTYDLPLNLIANSPWLAKILKEKYDRESSVIVPGVDSKVFSCSVPKAEDLPTEEQQMPLKVLAFSSPTPFKGFYDTVLPAFNYVRRALGKKVEFHLYGNPALQVPYDFPIVKHGNLSDCDLAALYRSCDLFVSGSWAESSPLPHLEAMASGCPVVCTEFGTEHYGEALYRVKPKAPRLLGESIVSVLNNTDLRLKMSQYGLESVKEFTWQNTVDKADCFFKGLVGEA